MVFMDIWSLFTGGLSHRLDCIIFLEIFRALIVSHVRSLLNLL